MNIKEESKLKMPRIPRFYTVPETACIMDVRTEDVRTWIEEGRLKAYRLGSYNNITRIRSQDLDEFIREYTAQRPAHNKHPG